MLLMPPKLKPFRRLRGENVAILDVGCGNHSPSVAKHWFPTAAYHAIDCVVYNNTPDDVTAIDSFYCLDLQTSSLDEVPDDHFDAIIMAHVIEHVTNGEDVIRALARKLKPGGRIYVECPSEQSLKLPSGVDSLNFHDDPSHVRLYSLPVLRRACEDSGLRVLQAAVRRDPVWMCVGLLQLPRQVKALIGQHKPYGPGLWDLLGFAHFVLAERPSA